MHQASSVRDALTALQSLASHLGSLDLGYPAEPPLFHPPAPAAALDELEASIGTSLPSDYRTFHLLCEGVTARDVHNGYELFRPPIVLRVLADGSTPRFLDQTKTVPLLPIGGDGGGNLFLLQLRPGSAVWKWNHAHPVNNAVPNRASMNQIASDFVSFLARVAEDWLHFLNDDQTWQFLSG